MTRVPTRLSSCVYVEQAWFSLMHALLESLRAEIPSVKLNFCETIFSPQNDGLGPRFVSGDKKREISMLAELKCLWRVGQRSTYLRIYIFNTARISNSNKFHYRYIPTIYIIINYLSGQASDPSG